jgi:hypothetical protein
VDGRALDHMGSEEDGKRKNMAGNRERERGRGGSGLCRCRRCSMSQGAPRRFSRASERNFIFLLERVRELQFPWDSEGES